MTDLIPPPPTEPPSVPLVPAEVAVPAAPAKKRPSPLAAGLIGLALGAGIVGGTWAVTAAGGPGKPGTFTLEGEFTLLENASETGGGCEGTGGYDDISEGTSVTVYGADGEVIATGHLGDSKSVTYDTWMFNIAVPDVPKGGSLG
ncbi:hypothetical protein [Streptomyces sp. NPDC048419]|uniref:hypothetical protein n=1 Tax=Streptomyces sp. NPDC048419 TaxID=3365547 RepID=UPI00371BD3FF